MKQEWTMGSPGQGTLADAVGELRETVDMEAYEGREFLAMQLRQIKLGLEEGLPVETYADPAYDWLQMEEIRKGLRAGIRVEIYASPEISFDKMHQIRKGLQAGIDLSPYRKLEAGILRQLRLAILDRVNIVQFINAGYDKEQLEVIRMALKKGLSLDPYLSRDFLGISLQEICYGLEHGLEVSVYARPEYCWQQMREIRLGMEHMVDIDLYKNHYYTWQQMQEIRLGLEEGLDVSCYRSLLYTAREMNARRMGLKDHTLPVAASEEEIPEQPESRDCFVVRISPDEMTATLEVRGNAKDCRREEILRALGQKGICYGICYEEIDRIVGGNFLRGPILIAQGTPARDGEDGWYEFFFRTEIQKAPKLLEDGNVDYRDIEWYETVEEGQKLAVYHGATFGEAGMTVKGRTAPARRGREQGILTGSGFIRLPDGKTYMSVSRGIVTVQGTKLEISDLMVVDEVNLTTGNVDFDGNVLIRGNVGSGTKIRAGKDVIVKGFVESAQIVCGGDVVLHQGMNAAGSGRIRAGGDVTGNFFEAADIEACGNIRGDYFLNCTMHTKKRLLVTGKKGMLAGGSVMADGGLQAFCLGNQAGLATYVRIGLGERIMSREKELEKKVAEVKQDISTLEDAHRKMQRKYPTEIRNSMDIYLKIESAIYTKEKELDALQKVWDSLEKEKKNAHLVSAVILNQLYEGVTIDIDGRKWLSKKVKGVTVKKVNDRISVCQN